MLILKYLFDVFIPINLRDDEVLYAYAKTIVVIGLLGLLVEPIWVYAFYCMNMMVLACVNAFEILFLPFIVCMMRVTKSIVIPRELMVLALTIHLTYTSFILGGISSASAFWLVLPPLICIIMGGFRMGIFWFIIEITLIVIMYFYEQPSMLDQSYLLPLFLLSLISLLIVVLSIVYFSEQGKVQGLRLQYRAYHDSLTKTMNRFTFEDKLKQQLNSGKINKNKFALISIDIDNFNSINNTLGFDAGDFLLVEVTKRCKKLLPPNAWLARAGNDEFFILMTMYDYEHTKLFMQHLLSSLANPYYYASYELTSSCSIGVAFYPDDATNLRSLIRYNNLALEYAKFLKGNNAQYFVKEMAKEDSYRLAIQKHLPYALKKGELYVCYQPKFLCSEKNTITGLEVLLRWNNPSLGQVSPEVFIPIAEEMGLIIEIGDWVLSSALIQYKQWMTDGYLKSAMTLAVNVSMHQMRKKEIYTQIKNALETADVSPRSLEIEITESVFLGKKEAIIDNLSRLKKLGVLIALDDFGVGYSSLSYLQQIPLTSMKIDKSFLVQDNHSMIPFMIQLAHKLGLKVIAEGVENELQFEYLCQHQCDYAQGYYLCKPLLPEEVIELFTHSSK